MINGRKVAALCVSEIQNENTQSMICAVYEALRKNGWRCLIFNTASDLFQNSSFDQGEAGIFQLIHSSYIDAVVIYPEYLKCKEIVEDILQGAQKEQIPAFLVEPTEKYSCGIRVVFEEENAFRDLVTHLAEDHHFTRFGCIAGFAGNLVSEKREQIFRDVLAQHDISFDEKWFGHGNFYDVPTKELMERFLAESEPLPEAIVCINDSMAIAACEVLTEHGVRVPEDVVVTGFDGIVQEQYHAPRLTTCRRNLAEFGRFLAQLMERAESGEEMQSEYAFSYQLDVSESCGCRKPSANALSRAIGSVYNRMNDIAQHDRSMNNMLTKLTLEKEEEKIRDIMRYYICADTYLCMNVDFSEALREEHTYKYMPFSPVMDAYRYFYGEENQPPEQFAVTNLLPNWDAMDRGNAPIVIFSIHNQQTIYGYMAVLASPFHFAVQRMQRFALTLNSCIGMYVQQEHLRRSNQRLKEIQNKIIVSFADMVESRDDFTGQHVKRTSEYLRILVKHLAKNPKYARIMTPEMQDLMYKSAPLHDIGKIKISDVVLNKPGRLTPEEFDMIKMHTIYGGEIIDKTLTDIESEKYLKIARDMAVYHHEKWDGSGYPYHLAGEEIPLSARIMAVVDVFDALTSKRVYKAAFPPEKAFQILEESSGSHFDPDIVGTFLQHREEAEQILRSYRDVFESA